MKELTCLFFLVIVNCMRARVHCHAVPYALAAHLHPCTSSSPAGLLLVRAELICVHTLTQMSHLSLTQAWAVPLSERYDFVL